jgi:PAS domain S-box-containing protein
MSTMTPFDLAILAAIVVAVTLLGRALVMIRRSRAERRIFEQQLRDSEARSRAVTESMLDAVLTTAPDGMIVDVNHAALRMFGYERTDLIGRNVVELVPERHREFFAAMIAQLGSRADNFHEEEREARALRTDGVELHVKVSFADIRVGGERLFVGIVRNVSDRKRIADALRESEAQMRQITNAMPALIAYVDADERFRFHNKAYQDYFQLTPAQIDGHTVREVFGEDFYSAVRPKILEVFEGHPVTYERKQRNRLGEERHMAVHYFPRYDGDAEAGHVLGFYALTTDITELKRIDRMKSEFVSTVSHELRTPLTSIRGSLGLIAGGVAGPLPEAAKSLVEIAKNNCDRLIRLINDILDSEKIESGNMSFEFKVVELRSLLARALADNEGFAAQHSVRLDLGAADETIRVNVDPDRLIQVVTNLVSNAVKFSPRHSAVEVRIRRSGNRVRVEVQDRGPGIPDEFRARIFQKFSQADSSDTRQKGGTGLGLSIAKAIVERLDGIIGFTSKAGQGTRFFFELPEWSESRSGQRTRTLEAARLRILVCEDDPDIARLLCLMLENAGFEVDVARDAARARALLAGARYAAMTVDIALPGEDGLSLIRSLRETEPTRALPVIVVSARADEGRVEIDNESLTVTDWLQKPIDQNRLVVGIRKAAGAHDRRSSQTP